MPAPSPPPLSKSLEKGPTRRRSSTTGSHGGDRDVSPSKSVSSRRSSVSRARTTSGAGRRSFTAGNAQNVRSLVRNKMAERKDGLRTSSHHQQQQRRSSSRQQNNNSNHSASIHSAPLNKRSSHSNSGSGGKKNGRPGSVSAFLKSTHRQLKADIAKIQDQIIFLCVPRVRRVPKAAPFQSIGLVISRLTLTKRTLTFCFSLPCLQARPCSDERIEED